MGQPVIDAGDSETISRQPRRRATIFGAILPAASVHPNNNWKRARDFLGSIEIKLDLLFTNC